MKNNESPEDFLEVLSAVTNKRARFAIDTRQKRVTKNVPNFRDDVYKNISTNEIQMEAAKNSAKPCS